MWPAVGLSQLMKETFAMQTNGWHNGQHLRKVDRLAIICESDLNDGHLWSQLIRLFDGTPFVSLLLSSLSLISSDTGPIKGRPEEKEEAVTLTSQSLPMQWAPPKTGRRVDTLTNCLGQRAGGETLSSYRERD